MRIHTHTHTNTSNNYPGKGTEEITGSEEGAGKVYNVMWRTESNGIGQRFAHSQVIPKPYEQSGTRFAEVSW